MISTSRQPQPIAAILALALWATTTPADAQTTSPTSTEASTPASDVEREAQGHFDNGLALMDQGKPAEACAEFAQSERPQPTMATQYQLGRCHEALGHYATARDSYLEAARMAEQSGDIKRAAVARERAAELELKAPRLLLMVPPEAFGLTLTANGRELPKASWGQPVLVDPGTVKVEAKAAGKQPWTFEVSAKGDGTVIKVSIPQLVAVGAKPPPGYGQQPGQPSGPDAPPVDEGPTERRNPTLFWTGLGLTIGGGGALVTGAIISGTTCSSCDIPTAGVATLVAGVALAGAGVPLLIVFGRQVPVEQPPLPTAALQLSPTGAGLRLRF